jgi:hypothetical protein
MIVLSVYAINTLKTHLLNKKDDQPFHKYFQELFPEMFENLEKAYEGKTSFEFLLKFADLKKYFQKHSQMIVCADCNTWKMNSCPCEKENVIVKYVVACRDQDGNPDLYYCIAELTKEVFKGDYRRIAELDAIKNGFQDAIVYTEEDKFDSLFQNFDWEALTLIKN